MHLSQGQNTLEGDCVGILVLGLPGSIEGILIMVHLDLISMPSQPSHVRKRIADEAAKPA